MPFCEEPFMKSSVARLVLGGVLCGAASLTSACSSDVDDGLAAEDAFNESGPKADALLFRNDFATYLAQSGYSDEQIRRLALVPTRRVLAPGARVTSDAPLEDLDAAFKKVRPLDLYKLSVATPTKALGDLEKELRSSPVHIIVVPGIFGEIIPNAPYEEVLKNGGTAAKEFKRKLADIAKDPRRASVTRDKQYNLVDLADKEYAMSDLMRVGSIDAADGTPLVTYTYLNPQINSLETYGTLDENVDYYLPRLEKYFAIVGIPDHLYFMGYSRGAATGLNLLSRADRQHARWLPATKGFISLGGVIFGTPLADATRQSGPQNDLLGGVLGLVKDLRPCQGTTPSAAVAKTNQDLSNAFAARLPALIAALPNHDEEFAREGLDAAPPDLAKLADFARRLVLGDRKTALESTQPNDDGMTGFLEGDPSADYCRNVLRAKKAAVQLAKGIDTLTTSARLSWFRTHTLPSSLRYFAMTGVMGDATAEGGQPSVLTTNPDSFDRRSVDYRSLRGNFYDLFDATGGQDFQDSQVPGQRAMFWPDVMRALNPAQRPLRTHFMGVMDAHHWGFAFPRAFSSLDGREANPFPRTIFLKAMATFVAQVERGQGSP
jgi:hypothetical protein